MEAGSPYPRIRGHQPLPPVGDGAHPADVGLPEDGRRRVVGLRREEVAMLAGISAEYYLRLEQGRDRHPSEQVLDGIARALQLEDDAAS